MAALACRPAGGGLSCSANGGASKSITAGGGGGGGMPIKVFGSPPPLTPGLPDGACPEAVCPSGACCACCFFFCSASARSRDSMRSAGGGGGTGGGGGGAKASSPSVCFSRDDGLRPWRRTRRLARSTSRFVSQISFSAAVVATDAEAGRADVAGGSVVGSAAAESWRCQSCRKCTTSGTGKLSRVGRGEWCPRLLSPVPPSTSPAPSAHCPFARPCSSPLDRKAAAAKGLPTGLDDPRRDASDPRRAREAAAAAAAARPVRSPDGDPCGRGRPEPRAEARSPWLVWARNARPRSPGCWSPRERWRRREP